MIPDGYQAYKQCSASGRAAEVIESRTMINEAKVAACSEIQLGYAIRDSLRVKTRQGAAVVSGFSKKISTELRDNHSAVQVSRPGQNARGV